MKISEFLESLDGCGLIISDLALLSEELCSWNYHDGLDTEMEILPSNSDCDIIIEKET